MADTKTATLPILPAVPFKDVNLDDLNARYDRGEAYDILAKYASDDGVDLDTALKFALVSGKAADALMAAYPRSQSIGLAESLRYAIYAAYQMGAESSGKAVTTKFDPDGDCGCAPCQWRKSHKDEFSLAQLRSADFSDKLPN